MIEFVIRAENVADLLAQLDAVRAGLRDLLVALPSRDRVELPALHDGFGLALWGEPDGRPLGAPATTLIGGGT